MTVVLPVNYLNFASTSELVGVLRAEISERSATFLTPALSATLSATLSLTQQATQQATHLATLLATLFRTDRPTRQYASKRTPRSAMLPGFFIGLMATRLAKAVS